jgi:hypothetical protein
MMNDWQINCLQGNNIDLQMSEWQMENSKLAS